MERDDTEGRVTDRAGRPPSNPDGPRTTTRARQSTVRGDGQSSEPRRAGDRSRDENPALSVVIVARNEVERIGDCIESVLEVTSVVGDTEVIVVDSNSSDGTVDVAREYPVTVLRIPTDALSSAEAGRHVGQYHAAGDLVMFVDGDIELYEGWLDDAVAEIRSDSEVAGVDGYLNEVDGSGGDADYIHGVALYDAAALAETGGFDPRLQALGDVDVGLRLRQAGYRLRRLPVLVGSHPEPETSGVAERLRRWRLGYYTSNGEVLRRSLDDPRLLATWVYRFRLNLSMAAWLAVGALAALRRRTAALGWGAASAAGVAGLVALKGVRWTVMKLTLRMTLFVAGIALGLWRGPQPETFPLHEVEVVSLPEADRTPPLRDA